MVHFCMRKSFVKICTGLMLLVGVCACAQPFLEAHFTHLLHQRELRRFLRKLELPVDAEHLELARITRTPLHPPPFERVPEQDAAFFAEGIPYRILDERDLRIVVYREDAEAWHHFPALVDALQQKAAERRIHLSLASDAQALLAAFRSADIVIFSGHANYGKGLRLRTKASGEKILWNLPGSKQGQMAADLQEKFSGTPQHPFPELHAPLFIHLGCRTDIYYRNALQNAFPDTGLVLTHYAWGPGISFSEALDLLIEAVHTRKTLPDLLSAWETLFLHEQFHGRSRERRLYQNFDPLPGSLFVHHPPACRHEANPSCRMHGH